MGVYEISVYPSRGPGKLEEGAVVARYSNIEGAGIASGSGWFSCWA